MFDPVYSEDEPTNIFAKFPWLDAHSAPCV